LGRIANWALKLMALDITYVSQMEIKSQALAEFVAKWTKTQQAPTPITQDHQSMYFDGSFILNGAGGGMVLISPKRDRLLYVMRLHFHVTNNVVEYEALVNDLCIAVELGVQRLYICGDSERTINQVMGQLKCHTWY
jgi:hypothetical protein